MTRWFDQLNLSPTERRIVLVGLVLVVLILNRILVWPYFLEWGPTGERLQKARNQIARFAAEIGNKSRYESQLRTLQGAGASVLQEDQANRVQQNIYSQAGANGVLIKNLSPIGSVGGTGRTPSTSTNQASQFFDEVRMRVEVSAGEKELVDFLYSLGSGDSNIRVRDLTNLRLDPTKTKLECTLGLVASFQKKAPSPPPSSKPATNAPAKPGTVTPKGPASTNRPASKPK